MSKGEEDTLSCFLFLYQCISVGQPSILLAFCVLRCAVPMFRWSGSSVVDNELSVALSGVGRRFRWCIISLGWVSILSPGKEV